MKSHLKKFLRDNIILAIIILIVEVVLFLSILREYYYPFIPILLAIAFAINVVLFYSATSKKVTDTMLLSIVVKSFAIKFFSYIAIAIIFLFLEKTRVIRITFVAVLFVYYFSFTWLEIQSLLKFLKTGENK